VQTPHFITNTLSIITVVELKLDNPYGDASVTNITTCRHTSTLASNFQHCFANWRRVAAHEGRVAPISNTCLFFVFLSVFFLQTCLGTWDRISSTCTWSKASWIYIPCLSNSSRGVWLCRITWFL